MMFSFCHAGLIVPHFLDKSYKWVCPGIQLHVVYCFILHLLPLHIVFIALLGHGF